MTSSRNASMGPFPICIPRLTSFSFSMIHTLRSSLRFHKRGSFESVGPLFCLTGAVSDLNFTAMNINPLCGRILRHSCKTLPDIIFH